MFNDDHKNHCDCEICKNNKPFELPDELVEEIIAQKVVVFAGAGISTENRTVIPITFYESVCDEIDIVVDENLKFPDLMSKYCTRLNGRKLLLQRIRERFDYVKSFPELYKRATRFHRELSTIFPLDTIVTTNWDDYFENECGAMPFVVAEDFIFWDMPGRKVYKLHGSINSYSSIIVTREDYDDSYNQMSTGLLGGYLKLLLATKTILYIGFSFTDEDFIAINSYISKEMGKNHVFSYIITLDQSSDARFKDLGLIPIYTSGDFFLKVLKEKLIDKKVMLDDVDLDKSEFFLYEVTELHEDLFRSIDLTTRPDAIYSLAYQDGLIHSLERFFSMKKTGWYSCPTNILNAIYKYSQLKKEKYSTKKYFDVAYIDGYINGLQYLMSDDSSKEFITPFYVFGYKSIITSQEEFHRLLEQAPFIHKSGHNRAIRMINKINIGDDISLHHTPFL